LPRCRGTLAGSDEPFDIKPCTRLAGLSARQIADHLGHSRPSLTQDVYLGRETANPQAAAALQRSL
jgi:hypothetical protein